MFQVNLSNDILFYLVMQDPKRCRTLLEMILGFEIERVEVIPQKTIQPGFFQKGIRLDIFAKDPKNTRYDVEMQTSRNKALGKRFRYYQGKVDYDALERGHHYKDMPNSYIIFICTFDPFGKEQYRYTIKPICEEVDIDVNSGQTWIVLNTEGKNGNISQEMKEFLAYVKDSCEANVTNGYLEGISAAVAEFLSGEWRDDIMTLEERLQEVRESTFEEACEKGGVLKMIALVCKKLIKGQDAATIADALEEDEVYIQKIITVANKYAPDYDVEKIYTALCSESANQ